MIACNADALKVLIAKRVKQFNLKKIIKNQNIKTVRRVGPWTRPLGDMKIILTRYNFTHAF